MTAHTVLVVDDEPASVRAVERALADEHRVITATAATQGLAAVQTEPVSLMIVDQRMPEMSGTELLARSMAERPEIIRVLLTGYTGIETLVEAINAGHVYYYLTKPWEPRDLRLVVRRGLEHYETEAERRRLVGELQQAYQRVRREADQKGRLLTAAAHELGTPLHLIINALTFIEESESPAQAAPWFAMAHRGVDWLGRCLAQLLAGGTWGTNGLRLRPRPVDVATLVGEVEEAYRPILATRRLSLTIEVAATLPPISADPLWLGRALSNLVSNAVRFTPDGGRLAVSGRQVGSGVEIGVADTGTGIDASVLGELFEPFSAACGDLSLHTSGRFEFGARGLGLGLAITKAIVEQHGGRIAVRTEVGRGSQFTITLPTESSAVVAQ